MTPEEATEILKNYLRGDESDDALALPASIRLGCEALAFVEYLQNAHFPITFFKPPILPSQTFTAPGLLL